MANVAEKIAAQILTDNPLQAVLRQRSAAYGTVAGALDEVASCIGRGQESDALGRQARKALVEAIHAPREEAEVIADELTRLARNALGTEVQP